MTTLLLFLEKKQNKIKAQISHAILHFFCTRKNAFLVPKNSYKYITQYKPSWFKSKKLCISTLVLKIVKVNLLYCPNLAYTYDIHRWMKLQIYLRSGLGEWWHLLDSGTSHSAYPFQCCTQKPLFPLIRLCMPCILLHSGRWWLSFIMLSTTGLFLLFFLIFQKYRYTVILQRVSF